MMRYVLRLLAATLLLFAGCERQETAAGVRVPLSGTGSGGTVYVLQGARFRITGPRNQTLNGDDASGTAVSTGLPVGDYEVRLLDGWQLVRLPEGTPMVATLASPNPQPVTVSTGMRASVVFVFDVMGEMVAMTGDGDIDIGFEVREPDAGMDAGAGTCMDGEMRSCGSDVGECVSGVQYCMGGSWTLPCMGSVGPTMEVCSGRDEDCDGVIDEGLMCADAGAPDAGAGGPPGEYASWRLPPASPSPSQYMRYPGMGVVEDTLTGLWWEEAPVPMTFRHADAQIYCAGLTAGGFSDFRLPTRVELGSIVDYGRARPAIDTTIFQVGAMAGRFWTATPYAFTPTDFYDVDLFLGGMQNSSPTSFNRVICVR